MIVFNVNALFLKPDSALCAWKAQTPKIEKGYTDSAAGGGGAVRVSREETVLPPFSPSGQSELDSVQGRGSEAAWISDLAESGGNPVQRFREEHASQERGKSLN